MTTQEIRRPSVSAVWNAPYMRSKLNEDGPLYPRAGTVSGSPDIIPFGRQQEPDPARFISDQVWKQDPGTSTTATYPNYLYVRGANDSRKSMPASVYLYYSKAMLLQWPYGKDGEQGWAQRPLKTGDQRDYQEVLIPGMDSPQKGRWVTPDAFIWVPVPLPDDHYCLVARLSAEGIPNPLPPDLKKIDDFAKYICEHPDLGWRNVSLLVPKEAVWIDRPLYLQGEQEAEMVFSVYVTGGVIGDPVTVKAATSGVDLDLKGTVKSDSDPLQLTQRAVVPANWKSEIVITYEARSGKLPPNLSARLEVLRVGYGPGDELAKYARPLRELGIRGLDDLTPLAIPLGGMHYQKMPAF